MKHLLILLSFLLLGCVKNQGTEFLYQYETSSGLIFKSIGDGKVQPKYKGEITNGKPNGQGTITYPDGGKYVGEFKDGNLMVKEHTLMEKGNGKETSMLGNGRMGKRMVKEHSLYLMEENM